MAAESLMAATKPLTIWIHPDYRGLPWVEALRSKGHQVYFEVDYSKADPSPWTADLLLGPNCARFLPGMEQFLDSFIKGARAVRYKPVDKESKT